MSDNIEKATNYSKYILICAINGGKIYRARTKKSIVQVYNRCDTFYRDGIYVIKPEEGHRIFPLFIVTYR